MYRLGWFGEAKVSCILRHQGVQLILSYSWARPAVLAAGKGTGVGGSILISSVSSLSFSSFPPIPPFHLFYSLFYLFFSISLGDDIN